MATSLRIVHPYPPTFCSIRTPAYSEGASGPSKHDVQQYPFRFDYSLPLYLVTYSLQHHRYLMKANAVGSNEFETSIRWLADPDMTLLDSPPLPCDNDQITRSHRYNANKRVNVSKSDPAEPPGASTILGFYLPSNSNDTDHLPCVFSVCYTNAVGGGAHPSSQQPSNITEYHETAPSENNHCPGSHANASPLITSAVTLPPT